MTKPTARHLAAMGLLAALTPAVAQEAPVTLESKTVASYAIPEANQGVGVDAEHFYAIDNRTIAKYDKAMQELVDTFT